MIRSFICVSLISTLINPFKMFGASSELVPTTSNTLIDQIHQSASFPSYMSEADQHFFYAWQKGTSTDSAQQKEAIPALESFIQNYGNNIQHINARLLLAHLQSNQTTSNDTTSLLLPILKEPNHNLRYHPQWLAMQQITASSMMYKLYLNQTKQTSALRSLVNALAFANNNNLFFIFPDQSTFPMHQPHTVSSLADLLRNPEHFNELHKQLDMSEFNKEEKDAFVEKLSYCAHQCGNANGTYFLALYHLKNKKFASAAELFASIHDKEDYTQFYAASLWLENTQQEQNTQEIINQWCDTLEHTEEIYNLIKMQNSKTLCISFLEDIYNYQENIKQKTWAAFKLCKHYARYNQERASDFFQFTAHNADQLKPKQIFYLSGMIKHTELSHKLLALAALNKHEKACETALNESTNIRETNPSMSQDLLHAAAKGGNCAAQLGYGLLLKKIAYDKKLAGKKRADIEKLYEEAKKWLARASKEHAIAYIELATIGDNYLVIIKQLQKFANDNNFSLQSRAQYQLARTHEFYAQQLEQEKAPQKVIDRQRERSLFWFEKQCPKDDIDKQADLAALYISLSLSQQKNKKKHRQTAMEICSKNLKEEPNHAQTLLLLGGHYSNIGQLDLAKDFLIRALKQRPHHEETKMAVHSLIHSLKEKECFDDIEEILTIATPHDPLALVLLGKMHLIRNNIDDALRCFIEAGERNNAEGYKFAAEFYWTRQQTKEDFEQAANYALKALNLDPNNIEAQLILASFYEDQGNDIQARQYWQKAANHGSAHGFMGLATCWQKGLGGPQNMQQASLYYQKAMEQFEKAHLVSNALEAKALARAAWFQHNEHIKTTDEQTIKSSYQLTVTTILSCMQSCIKEFDTLIALSPEKERLTEIKKRFIAECRTALSFQALEVARHIRIDKEHYRAAALKQLSQALHTENINGLVLLATSIIEHYNYPPQASLTDQGLKEIKEAQNCLETALEFYETKSPNSPILQDLYLYLGRTQEHVYENYEEAEIYYGAGLKHNSIDCIMHLARLYATKDNNFEEAHSLANAALDIAQKENKKLYVDYIQKYLKQLENHKELVAIEDSCTIG